jgi:hexokinase
MENNILSLTTKQLAEIAKRFEEKTKIGLTKDNDEIKCLLTYIKPKREIKSGKCLVLDWGGTNFRAAIVEFYEKEAPVVIESAKTRLSSEEIERIRQENKGKFKRENLFEAIAAVIKKLTKLDKNVENIGYCFSYAIESMSDGDAEVLEFAKGMVIDDMPGKLHPKKDVPEGNNIVGKPLLEYLNKNVNNADFKRIAVINDTIACLFGGLSEAKSDYDAYLGLIVGTGTNMATTMQTSKVSKVKALMPDYKGESILINTESGDFTPPYLTYLDDNLDAESGSKGKHRFEKAISGKYLAEIFKMMFPYDEFPHDDDPERFHAGALEDMINYPDVYKEKYVEAARAIFDRSAKLVATTLAGLIFVLKSQNSDLKSVLLTAEGTQFWSKDRKGTDYSKVVLRELNRLLVEHNCKDVTVEICKVPDANLIGSAIAAFSL